jgi:hypothetical protein
MQPDSDIVTAVTAKRELFEKILNISNKELQLLKSHPNDFGIIDDFIALVNQRQQLMEAVDRLDKGLLAVAGEELDSICKDQMSEIRSIILSIQENDEQCHRLARVLLDKLGNKAKTVHNQKKAYQAYAPEPLETGAWFFDKKK